jgi:hypothetical protein
MSSVRCLYKPRVMPSPDPGLVVVKVPTDSPESYFEMKLTPEEADDLGMSLLLDARRAKRHLETERWLKAKR